MQNILEVRIESNQKINLIFDSGANHQHISWHLYLRPFYF